MRKPLYKYTTLRHTDNGQIASVQRIGKPIKAVVLFTNPIDADTPPVLIEEARNDHYNSRWHHACSHGYKFGWVIRPRKVKYINEKGEEVTEEELVKSITDKYL